MKLGARRLVLVALLTAIGCPGGGKNGDGGSSNDPFAGLRDVAEGQLKCSGDECCYGYCAGNTFTAPGITCLSRDPALVAKKVVGASCTGIVFTESFYNQNCFAVIESKAQGSTEWIGSNWGIYQGTVNIPVACLCGAGSGTAASLNYSWTNFTFASCTQALTPTSWPAALSVCSGGCSGCQPNCTGRTCGSNGCGGSCGTCSSGTCNANGTCSSGGGGGDSCSSCLSSCRGISGCCTGCGCICQSACGGVCW
jgi:hypothetical protein